MKKIFSLLLLLYMVGCSDSDKEQVVEILPLELFLEMMMAVVMVLIFLTILTVDILCLIRGMR